MTETFPPSLDGPSAQLRRAGLRQHWMFIGGFLAMVVILLFLWRLVGQGPVNPNTASHEELMTLPEVSPELAQRILNLRPFTDEADFEKRVTGLPVQALTQMRTRLDFDGDGRGDCCVH